MLSDIRHTQTTLLRLKTLLVVAAVSKQSDQTRHNEAAPVIQCSSVENLQLYTLTRFV